MKRTILIDVYRWGQLWVKSFEQTSLRFEQGRLVVQSLSEPRSQHTLQLLSRCYVPNQMRISLQSVNIHKSKKMRNETNQIIEIEFKRKVQVR
jgi:hypothetical protein